MTAGYRLESCDHPAKQKHVLHPEVGACPSPLCEALFSLTDISRGLVVDKETTYWSLLYYQL